MKGLEALERLLGNQIFISLDRQQGKKQLAIDLNTIEKELKALEIIKEKNFDLYYLRYSKDLEMYNAACDHFGNLCYLTQEEYDLLKEVLL